METQIPPIPFSTPPTAGEAIHSLTDRRVTGRLGLPGAAFLLILPTAAFVWDGEGNAVMAIGAPASSLASARAGASRVASAQVTDVAPAAPPVTAEQLVAAVGPPLPSSNMDPLTYLATATDVNLLRDWVLTEGLASPHALLWAHFAQACGWSLPPPPERDEPAANPEVAAGGQ